MRKILRILEITAFSSGFCGLWSRVRTEAELLSKQGHDVYVFSSNIHRGSGKIEYAPSFEQKGKVKIFRFNIRGKIGENTFFWDYGKKALEIKPDIIICHAYRQYYSTKSIKIARKMKIPCILVTHAPFLDTKTRGWKLSLVAWVYDTFIGRRILGQYSRIFAISHWEIPYLLKLGVKREKIVYIPNGIPEDFFKLKIKKHTNKIQKILFLGRIAEIKNLETLVKAVKIVSSQNNNIILNLAGPIEEPYGAKLKLLIRTLGIEEKIKFLGPVYGLKEKIGLLDSSDLFVLPSKREGMPQALIEAMSRSKKVVGSNIPSIKDLIQEGKNGLLFDLNSPQDLAKKILLMLEENKKIAENARESVKQFSWKSLINKISDIIEEEVDHYKLNSHNL